MELQVTEPIAEEDGVPKLVRPGEENTGRWTKDEHARFLKGIDTHGKEWKKVAMLVKTRTVMQTRTHAQKYFEKVDKGTGKLPARAKVSGDMAQRGSDEKGKKDDAMINPFLPQAVTIVTLDGKDIVLPVTDQTAGRPGNKEYVDLMKANCFIFHCLPMSDQMWFARNLSHFMVTVRGRRFVSGSFPYQTTPSQQYHLLQDPANIIGTEFRMDALKLAALQFHPFWLLGEHDAANVHNGAPFVHRTVDGTWKTVKISEVKEILKGEGPKNLLLLPPSISLSVMPEQIPAVEAAKEGDEKEESKIDEAMEKDSEEETKEEASTPQRRSKRTKMV